VVGSSPSAQQLLSCPLTASLGVSLCFRFLVLLSRSDMKNGVPLAPHGEPSTPGFGEDKSVRDVSELGTRIHSGYRVRREARNVLNFEGKE